ncbi:TonB-dependent receptor [Pseudodesulfovibrio sp. JC047]|uniref:TonB-dependent receptor n=1 Tax=Pseudodesulfovibrio sp. JC047 TaxID=2683199 RepID=UPI0013D08704|nr:TonB-dependent receptor [Pseudodesulfovibrio sp. JC047]NDV18466.1 TonB-dependent receptor [Pseudodesulfovibrio sp. JC047]
MYRRTMTGLIFTFLFLVSCPALAQDAPPEAKEQAPVTMDAVTVTATKREGTVKDFPGNISVMDDVFIETHGTDELADLTRFAPNVYIKHTSSGGSIVCRGISTIDTSLFSPMGLYMNDVALPIGYMVNQDLFDIERVEILRGPQATLYGRNSESGVINIVLKEPDNTQRTRLMTELGNYSTVRMGGSTSGPLVEDKLFYSLSLLGKTTNGYVENTFRDDDDVAGEESIFGRGTLRWTPSKAWDIAVDLDGKNNNHGMSVLRYEDGPNATPRHEVRANEADRAHEKAFGQSARIKYAWPTMELTSITSHRSFDRDHLHDFDRTPIPLGTSEMDTELDSWGQEFRLASTDTTALSWLVGLYGRHETVDAGIDFNHINPLMASKRKGDSTDNGYAGFGQATYEMIEGLRLTGGLRLDVSRNSGKHTYTPNSGPVSYEKDIDNTEWLPMASLAYDFTPNVTAYTTVSRGFLAGGFNFFSATSADTFAYDPEHSMNYEAGIKTTWLDNTLTFNTTIFYTELSDKQVREEVPGAGMGVWKFTNAADAHTQGIEVEAAYNPIPELQFRAGFGYADAEVDKWDTTVGGTPVDYSGNKLPWAPEYTYTLSAEYNHQSGFFILADLLGTGEQYFDAANTIKDDGYQTVNLRVGYQVKDIEIALWCDNLLDEEYANKKVKNGAGLTLVEDGAPRTFGLTANWRF